MGLHTPASQGGLKEKDVLLEVNNMSVMFMTHSEVFSQFFLFIFFILFYLLLFHILLQDLVCFLVH